MKYTVKVRENNNQEINFRTWYEDYLQNPGRFWRILRQRIAIRKYTIEYGNELEDIMQEAVELVIKQFNKKKTISKRWMYTIFKMACINSINKHIRAYDKFAARPSQYMIEKFDLVRENPGNGFGWVGDGDRVPTTSGNYSVVDLKLDLARIFDQRQLRIINLLHLGFTQREIAAKFDVFPNQIHREVKKIRRIVNNAGLRQTA